MDDADDERFAKADDVNFWPAGILAAVLILALVAFSWPV